MVEQCNRPTLDTEYSGLWVVRDFAKRYRLDAQEEARLQKLHGPVARLEALLATARRY
ncbi:hypothetical protein RHI9324_02514 [Rhizobium sp. CECT 9324]|nr:hypothetical protein RHI9324_02514 [Rhizobium sp. CECT 9324]